MPRPSRGPHLVLRPARGDRSALYVIKDGDRTRGTGCGAQEHAQAERKLVDYIASKHDPRDSHGDPAFIPLADAINLYVQDVVPERSRPLETIARLERVLAFDGWTMLADVNGRTCRQYAKTLKQSAARRDLEDLRAAIRYHYREGLADREVKLVLPEKAAPRERWLTRDEAARLIWAAWRYREHQNGEATARAPRQHLARWLLIALYTGTRSSRILQASFERRPSCGFIDLETGMFYRQPSGERRSKKRAPPIRMPRRLLSHMRRWRTNGQTFAVEFAGQPVARIDHAFRRVVADAGLGPDVVPHVLRHTAVTWAMINGTKPYVAANYFGMSLDTLDRVYGHFHPDHSAVAGEAIVARVPDTYRKQPEKGAGIVF